MLGIVVSSRVLIRRPKPRLKSTLLTRLRKMIFPGRSRWSTRSGSKERVGAGSIPSDLQILLFLLFSWLVFGALLFKIIVAIMPLWQNSATYFKANAAQSDGFNGDSAIVFVLISDTFAICKLLIFFWNKVKKRKFVIMKVIERFVIVAKGVSFFSVPKSSKRWPMAARTSTGLLR